VYDTRNWGSSDGTPRLENDPAKSTDDYHEAVTYAISLPEVDPKRIALWGSSYSGGMVVIAGAVDRRVRAVIAQAPFVSGAAFIAPLDGTPVFDALYANRANIAQGGEPVYTPIIAASREAATKGDPNVVLGKLDAYEYFQEIEQRRAPWENKMSLDTLFKMAKFEPAAFIHRVAPTPLLFVIAEHDSAIPSAQQLAAYDQAREPKEIKILRGRGHFDVYSGEVMEENVNYQIDFLKRWL